jgi:hypothetical protein
MKRPAERAGPAVERTHFARRHSGAAVVCDERADDHQIAEERWRRAYAVLTDILGWPPQAAREIDLSVLAEVGASLTVLTLEADESRVDGANVDAIAANGEATARELAVVRVLANAKLRAPDFGARFRVQRDDRSARGGEIEPAGGVDRRRFEGRPLASFAEGFGRLARVVRPGDAKPHDVVDRNPFELRLRLARDNNRAETHQSNRYLTLQSGSTPRSTDTTSTPPM